ncbi:MAG TPA: histone deacetylase [Spirochaetia bacterium]|nr:histone deacetylase [Spirochaetia bacterium]
MSKRYYLPMILHRPGHRAPLSDYGIEIPAAPDRISKILAALAADPALGPIENEWLIGDDGGALTREDLERVHSPEYVNKLFTDEVEQVLIDVYELVDENGNYYRYNPANAKRPLKEMFDRTLRSQAGSYQCCREALERGFCFYLAGGGHHAHRDFGHGFCILNDIVIPLRRLQSEGRIKSAWIIDVDAHKGDGVADIAQDDESIVTLSAHMARGWPLDLPKTLADGSPNPVFIPSDIDIPIEHGEEPLYCARLREGLAKLDTYPRPDVALVQLGADPYEKDGLPSTAPLQLTLEQLYERDRIIYEFLEERRIPGAYLMSGGYGDHSWEPYPPFLIPVLKERLGLA